MKLEMSKANDGIEWDFLDVVLVRFGFDICWIKTGLWIVFVQSLFSGLVNSRSSEDSVPHRDIRQHMFLFFMRKISFILCVEEDN